MERELLINKINTAFKGVKLEDGIGLWEAQGHDDRLSPEECKQLRLKDEKKDWNNIPVIDLYKCSSSLSFFDAKGMRFYLPKFLLFELDVYENEENALSEQGLTNHCMAPDIVFHITSIVRYLNAPNASNKRMIEYCENRFSLINFQQTECLIDLIAYRKSELENYYDNRNTFGKSSPEIKNDEYYVELETAIEYWKNRQSTMNNEEFDR